MQTSYRDIALLACCQALLLVNNAGLIAMNGLVGYSLVESKTFATLGVTSYVLGSALAAMPAALYMARVGRRRGFMTGSLIAIVGSATCALGIAQASFPLYCLGTAVVGALPFLMIVVAAALWLTWMRQHRPRGCCEGRTVPGTLQEEDI